MASALAKHGDRRGRSRHRRRTIQHHSDHEILLPEPSSQFVWTLAILTTD